MDHSVLSAGGEGQGRPGLALSLSLLYDVVADWRAAIVFWEVPVEFAGVTAQVLSSEGDAHGPGYI